MRRAGGSGLRGRRIGRRILAVAVVIAALSFAVQGGEYGTLDLFSQRGARASLEREIATLKRTVDSLEAWTTAIANDPAVQERITREEFGMVRGDRELLYRFHEATDSVR